MNAFELVGRITINKSEALGDLRSVENAAEHSSGRIGQAFSRLGHALGTAVKAGAVAATAAITGIATKSVMEFSEFERRMNEVFTLLPDATEDMKAAMVADVKELAKEMGILPNEVVPALYQAISAGVPQDNVFDFMRVAGQAAIGGVTDLETAVDGLTSVVNAYGAETMSAQDAADALFTAVRLGKTNFEELSRNIFKVTPIAASLGIEFDEVAAAMAELTAQGVPTAEAATYLKSALNELSKEGMKAFDAFEEAAGVTFPEFIEQGGSMNEALAILDQYAADSGVSVKDLFGSIEGGQAILQLTGEHAEHFTGILDEFEDKAGAVEAAYTEMDKGIGRAMDKLKSATSTMFINLGEQLAPIIESLANWVTEHMDEIEAAISSAINVAKEVLGSLISFLRDVFKGDWDAVWDHVKGTLKNLWDALPIPAGVKQQIESVFLSIMSFLRDAFSGVVDYFKQQWEALTGFFTSVFTGDWQSALGAAKELFLNTFNLIGDTLRTIWDHLPIPDHIKGQVESALTSIKDFAVSAFGWIKDKALEAWSGIKSSIEDNAPGIISAWDGVKEAASRLWDAVKETFDRIAGAFSSSGESAVSWGDIVNGVFDAVLTVVETVVGAFADALDILAAALRGDWREVWTEFLEFIRGIWDGILAILDVIGLKDDLLRGWELLRDGTLAIWEAIKAGVQTAIDHITAGFQAFIDKTMDAINAVKQFFGVSQDIEGISGSVEEAIKKAADSLSKMANTNADANTQLEYFREHLEEATEGGMDLSEAVDIAMEYLRNGYAKYGDVAEDLADQIEDTVREMLNLETNAKNAGDAVTNGLAGGMRAGLPDVKDAAQDVVDTVDRTLQQGLGSGAPTRQAADGAARGLLGGLADAIPAIKGVTSDIIDGITNTFRDLLQIRSPSRVTFEIGMEIARGLADGMDTGSELVNYAALEVVNAADRGLSSMGGVVRRRSNEIIGELGRLSSEWLRTHEILGVQGDELLSGLGLPPLAAVPLYVGLSKDVNDFTGIARDWLDVHLLGREKKASSTVNINFNDTQVRDQSDIDELARAIADRVVARERSMGYAGA